MNTKFRAKAMKEDNNSDKITRKEAIQKMGKYAALTAVGTFVILNPLKAQSSSPPDAGGDPFD
ncbi:hypothetical protein KO504_12415 [Winogradskyella psychrotolerans]|uniref:hypothetical protein n=1 Tax=Winogradskyella psychrotolerans TaxID=1344585 RepID=UPI001C07404D|nr:hypothetical protein [Winogradskyella psychrotolerans]MBU2922148.1 hypothetical protein [Winogradskyella psychrotolerans]